MNIILPKDITKPVCLTVFWVNIPTQIWFKKIQAAHLLDVIYRHSSGQTLRMRLNNQQSFIFLLHFIGLTAPNLCIRLIPRMQNVQMRSFMNTGHIFSGLRFHLKVEKLFRSYSKTSWQEPDHMRGKDGTWLKANSWIWSLSIKKTYPHLDSYQTGTEVTRVLNIHQRLSLLSGASKWTPSLPHFPIEARSDNNKKEMREHDHVSFKWSLEVIPTL